MRKDIADSGKCCPKPISIQTKTINMKTNKELPNNKPNDSERCNICLGTGKVTMGGSFGGAVRTETCSCQKFKFMADSNDSVKESEDSYQEPKHWMEAVNFEYRVPTVQPESVEEAMDILIEIGMFAETAKAFPKGSVIWKMAENFANWQASQPRNDGLIEALDKMYFEQKQIHDNTEHYSVRMSTADFMASIDKVKYLFNQQP